MMKYYGVIVNYFGIVFINKLVKKLKEKLKDIYLMIVSII